MRAGRFERPARHFITGSGVAAAFALALTPAPALGQASPFAVEVVVRSAGRIDPGIAAFYAARGYRPLWIRGDQPGPEVARLFDLVRDADWDGLSPDELGVRGLGRALNAARNGSPRALARAELLASQTYAAYVRALRRPGRSPAVYVDAELQPTPPPARTVLDAAAAAPSLLDYVARMGWMHPLYGQLRQAAIAEDGALRGRDLQAELVRINLDRARMLPADRGQRYVVVDAAAARLYMYEGGRVRDSMRVVVGRATDPTPMMAGLIRHTILNPYWNVPTDLVADRIAARVVAEGRPYLTAKRYQVLSDWSERPTVVDPATIDWTAVAAGRTTLRMRQLPGPANAMGKMKFEFPNKQGIYLHDTPDGSLFGEAARLFSAGCVRLEDAPRFAKWLYGTPLRAKSTKPEIKVALPKTVPVYITYLTAAPEDGQVAYREDVYKRDAAQLAAALGRD